MAVEKVCVIEDDEGIRDIVRDLLTDVGYDVIEAATGLEGKEVLDASVERLIVVLDYRLPALDGCDLLEIVAHDEDLRERHTFIMMSASSPKSRSNIGISYLVCFLPPCGSEKASVRPGITLESFSPPIKRL